MEDPVASSGVVEYWSNGNSHLSTRLHPLLHHSNARTLLYKKRLLIPDSLTRDCVDLISPNICYPVGVDPEFDLASRL